MKKTLQTLVPAFLVLSLCSDAMGMDISYDQLDSHVGSFMTPVGQTDPYSFTGVVADSYSTMGYSSSSVGAAMMNTQYDLAKGNWETEKKTLEKARDEATTELAKLRTRFPQEDLACIVSGFQLALRPVKAFPCAIEVGKAADLGGLAALLNVFDAFKKNWSIAKAYAKVLSMAGFDNDSLLYAKLIGSDTVVGCLPVKQFAFLRGNQFAAAQTLLQRMFLLFPTLLGIDVLPAIKVTDGGKSAQWEFPALCAMHENRQAAATFSVGEFGRVCTLLAGEDFRDAGALLPANLGEFAAKKAGLDDVTTALKIREQIAKLDGANLSAKADNLAELLKLLPFVKSDGTMDIAQNGQQGTDGVAVADVQAAFDALVPDNGTNRSEVGVALFTLRELLHDRLCGDSKMFSRLEDARTFLSDTVKAANFEWMMALCNIVTTDKLLGAGPTDLAPTIKTLTIAAAKAELNRVKELHDKNATVGDQALALQQGARIMLSTPTDLYVAGAEGIVDEFKAFDFLKADMLPKVKAALKNNTELQQLANMIGNAQRGANAPAGIADGFGELFANNDPVGLHGAQIDADTAGALNTLLGLTAHNVTANGFQAGFQAQGVVLSAPALEAVKARIAEILLPIIKIEAIN